MFTGASRAAEMRIVPQNGNFARINHAGLNTSSLNGGILSFPKEIQCLVAAIWLNDADGHCAYQRTKRIH
jgi:hypothetical protein